VPKERIEGDLFRYRIEVVVPEYKFEGAVPKWRLYVDVSR